MLASMRMAPAAAASGVTALAELRKAATVATPFAVVLLNPDLPDMDGFELARKIRSDDALAATRLLLVATAGEPEHSGQARELGVERTLFKPVKQSDLLDAIAAPAGAARPAAVPRPSAPSGSVPPLCVLLAEDGLVNQQLATILLEQAGHTVVVVETGTAAVEAVDNGGFDLVFMDVQMPEMDGLEATRVIRHGRHVPIIAMTANAMKGDRELCLEAGMDGYVAKPIHINDLARAIEQVLPARRAGDAC
jgi:CheY-like chemotaxis protein